MATTCILHKKLRQQNELQRLKLLFLYVYRLIYNTKLELDTEGEQTTIQTPHKDILPPRRGSKPGKLPQSTATS